MLQTVSTTHRWISGLAGLFDWAFERPNRRRQPRVTINYPVTLSGPCPAFTASGLDLNTQGLGVVSPKPLPVGSEVFVRLETAGLMGSAVIRHCSGRGEAGYWLGLKFRESLANLRGRAGEWQVHFRSSKDVWDENCN